MKGKPILVLAALLIGIIPAVFPGNTITVDYTFNAQLVNNQLVIPGTIIQEIPGEPLIPLYTAKVLLPQNASVKNVTVKCSTPLIQEGIDILWGQPPCTFTHISNPGGQRVGKNEKVYNSNEWYPGPVYDVVSVESFRGYQIVTIFLYPLQYKPKSGTVKFYSSMSITLQCDEGDKPTLYRGLNTDREAVLSMVDNKDMITTYTPSEPLTPLTATYEYIIITNSDLTSAFNELIKHKANYVNGAALINISWILTNYTGYDSQEKIRNFIMDAYTNWDTSYCLLGGDASIIPSRELFVMSGDVIDYYVAADMYYGCLDGTFDADNDHIYGEPTDQPDFLEEVFIGRAPVETESEAELFVDKVITYEYAAKPEVCQFHQARGTSDNVPDFRQIAWDCEQWVPNNYERRELFEEDGHISKDDWRDAWGGNPLLFQHAGHGDTTLYNINYIIDGEVTWTNSDVSTLSNTFWPIHMSVACFSGNFDDYDDCLAETYITDDCGAIACMLNDSYGWYSYEDASKYSGEFLETMFKGLFIDGKQHLGELLNQAKSYWVAAARKDVFYRWCYYEINLLGDPETPCLTRRQNLQNSHGVLLGYGLSLNVVRVHAS